MKPATEAMVAKTTAATTAKIRIMIEATEKIKR